MPLAGQTSLATDILNVARRNLRCIDWNNITVELMTSSTSTIHDRTLPRPVRAGERIDYFMSHSWHDDGRLKFQKLQWLANGFLQKRSRSPTFWLDKVCIDQDAIADGLRALPINVMACRRLLLVLGSTYASRLWCAWELCTLFSFSDAEKVAEGVEILLLESGESGFSSTVFFFNNCPGKIIN